MTPQKTNYDQIFRQTTAKIDRTAPPKLLLHVCCAPCATYCLTQVLPFFDVTLLYANDNITDEKEWRKRLAEVEKLTGIVNDGRFETVPLCKMKLEIPPFAPQTFFDAVKGYEEAKEGGARCSLCFKMRLESAARFAKEGGFAFFGTTLTVSPYKNSAVLNAVGGRVAAETGVDFLFSDFKKNDGYRQSVALSQKYALYRQHYCGCAFSLGETSD